MSPRLTPFHSSSTFTTGAIEFVVQEAALTIGRLFLRISSFTPRTIIAISSLGGAVTRTALAPAVRCASLFSRVRNFPEDSTTISTFSFFHGHFSGSRSFTTRTGDPFTRRFSPSSSTSPTNLPWRVSYFKRYCRMAASLDALMATTSTSFGKRSTSCRCTTRPILPYPLIATRSIRPYCRGKRQRAKVKRKRRKKKDLLSSFILFFSLSPFHF